MSIRQTYRPLSDDEKQALSQLKAKGLVLIEAIEKLPRSREQALAITNVEQGVMWATSALTA